MNRRQFFGALAGAAAVAKLPAAPAPLVALDGIGFHMAQWDASLALSMEEFSKRYLQPAVDSMTKDWDDQMHELINLNPVTPWTVSFSEPEVYVSPRVATADRLFDLAEVIE